MREKCMAKSDLYSWTRDNITHTVRLSDIIAIKEVAPPEACVLHFRSGLQLQVSQDIAATIKPLLSATQS
jgi:hypothetical protein